MTISAQKDWPTVLLCPGIDSVEGRLGGEPCFVGTRITVKAVATVARLRGLSEARRKYPQLTLEQINLALAFAAGTEWRP